MKDEYPDSKSDLFAGFIERIVTMVRPHGYMAQVTMQSWMFLSSYEKLRSKLQRSASIVAMLHMDNMVMRIAFGTSATVWEIGGDAGLAGKYTWIEIDDLDGDEPRLFPAQNVRNATAGADGYFTVAQSEMTTIPGSPIVYWLSEKMRAAFKVGKPLSDVAESNQGLITADNDRFLRKWWEVSESRTGLNYLSRAEASGSRRRWFPYNKGGDFRRWYGNHEYVVNWERDGAEIRAFGTEEGGRPRSRAQNTSTYFSPAVSWSAITSGNPSFRYYRQGFIPSNAGMACYAQETTLMSVVSAANSAVAEQLLSAIAPTLNLGAGETARLPMPTRSDDGIQPRVNVLIENSSVDWNSAETSWEFEENPLVRTWRNSASGHP